MALPPWLFRLAYSLCLARFFALIIISLGPKAFRLPPTARLFLPPVGFAFKLDLTLPPALALGLTIWEGVMPPPSLASRCVANFAITLEREILGLRPIVL
jgi:hypothetical protein